MVAERENLFSEKSGGRDFVRRTDSVRIKLSPEMLARVEVQAKGFSMPVATVCAFAVAEWVQNRERGMAMAQSAVTNMTPVMEAIIREQVACGAMTQEQAEQALAEIPRV